MSTPKPVKGIRFRHAGRGVECYIVRVTRTSVYYRLASGVGGGNFPIKEWPNKYQSLKG